MAPNQRLRQGRVTEGADQIKAVKQPPDHVRPVRAVPQAAQAETSAAGCHSGGAEATRLPPSGM